MSTGDRWGMVVGYVPGWKVVSRRMFLNLPMYWKPEEEEKGDLSSDGSFGEDSERAGGD